MTFDEPSTTEDVIKSCEDVDSKVKLPPTVDEVVTSADKEFPLNTVDTGVEVLLRNTAEEVSKFTNDVEGNVPLSELVMPTVELCSPNDLLAAGSELCMEGVKEVALETGFEVDNKATVPTTCVKDEEVFAVVL